MLDSKGFDLWADGYDKSVGLSDEENVYPFAGYREILNRIYNTVLVRKNAVVCDIGFGTGVLTSRLADAGCEVWGQDFSAEMLKIASRKMPSAMKALLKPDGAILIGDVMFETRAELTRCREEAGDEWDDEEIYIVTEELGSAIPNLEFTQISHCAGVLTIHK